MTRITPPVIRSTSHGFDKRQMTVIYHMPNLRLVPLLPADALRELPTHFSLRRPFNSKITKNFLAKYLVIPKFSLPLQSETRVK